MNNSPFDLDPETGFDKAQNADPLGSSVATCSNAGLSKGLKYLGEGIAFAALCGSAAWLETSGCPASVLWIVVVLWAFNFG